MKKFLYIFLILLVFFIVINFNFIKENLLNFFNLRKSCDLETIICPDGTVVNRILPKFNFAPCPTIKTNKKVNENICGGIANIECPEGYYCQIT